MKKMLMLLILIIALSSCRAKYETIYINDDGFPVYRTLCRKDSTKCLVNASDACGGRYEIVEWIERGYHYRPTPAEAAISIVNTATTKQQSSINTGSYSVTEGLIFSCK